MAQYGDQYGNTQNQEFGTQPAHDHAGGNMVGQGVMSGGINTHGLSGGEHPRQPQKQEQHGEHEKLHRTNSLSSSEDDGEGGRRKKGLTEKITEKIPGVGNKEPQLSHETGPNTMATTGGDVVHGEEKKGLMDKIKEKLPGTN